MSEPMAPRANSADLPMPTIAPSSASSASARGDASSADGRSAGQLLRQARLAQGLHVAALAAAIKVTPAKLEALEAEHFDELPDPTFARALALAVCRHLKIDAEPVLSRLPQPRAHRLEHIHRGLATPFRGDQDSRDQGDLGAVLRPAVLAPVLVLLAALVVWVAPDSWWKLASLRSSSPPTDVAASEVSGNAAMPPVPTQEPSPPAQAPAVQPPTAAAPVPPPTNAAPAAVAAPVIAALTTGSSSASASTPRAAAAATAAAPASSSPASGDGPLVITATTESWVEVIDGTGRTLFSRSIPAGQSVNLDGPAPLKLRVGNVAGTQVTWKGQKVALTSPTNSNVARLELK